MTALNFVLCVSLLCGLCAGLSLKGAPQPLTDEAKLTELRTNVDTHLRRLGAQPNGAQLEFLRLHSATSQTVAGTLYKILAEINENNEACNCTLSLWEKPWENFTKFDVECGPEGAKRVYGFIDPVDATTELPNPPKRLYGLADPAFSPTYIAPVVPELSCDGCPIAISEESLKGFHPRIVDSFAKLSSKYDDFDLIVKRVVSGTSQVVAGVRYVLTVEATNPKDELRTCEADIWDKSWENFHRLRLKCQEKNYEIHL